MSIANTTIPYRALSASGGAERKPKGPAPYETFTKTFSYAPADGKGISPGGSAPQQSTAKDILKQVQDLEATTQALLDVQEIENVMSVHVLRNKGCAKPGDADYRETVAQTTPGVCYGQDGKYLYDDEARKAIHGLDDPTFGKPGTLKMHMLTTALVHVAGDGQ